MIDAQYKIIGGDGAEYGPASLDELQGWIRDGRVASTTQVWRDDLLKWLPAEGYGELKGDLVRLQANAAAVARTSARPVGFWARLAAHLVDRLVVMIFFSFLWIPLSDAYHWEPLPQPPSLSDQTAVTKYWDELTLWTDRASLIYLPIFMVYEVLMNGSIGATLGKLAIGARIRMNNGARISYNRAFLRWWGARLSEFLLFTGYLLIAVRSDKRALHDILAGTKVVYLR